ncbi:MAG: ABC transporter ATP-binding protein [Actinomycetota bacterium]
MADVDPIERRPDDEVALRVTDLRKTFRIHRERANSLKQLLVGGGRNRYEEFVAVDGVSFDVPTGQALGIIGHNGSGKSTLLKCMARILTPNGGSVTYDKRMAGLLELGAGFHADLSGRDNVFLNAAILGMPRKEIARRFDEIVEFSGLGDFVESQVKTYSSGMYLRLAFSVAIHVDPELLLIDEILAVGDVAFQRKCMDRFVQFRAEGRTLIIVTHDTSSVRHFCDRAIWMDHGSIVEDGKPAPVIDRYTESMLAGTIDAETGGVRRGDGPVRVRSIEMTTTHGGPVRTGDDVTVRLHWHADEPVKRPVFIVKLASNVGVEVTAPANTDAGVVLDEARGEGVAEVRFPRFDLMPGSYVVHTEVTGPGRTLVYDHLQDALSFEVSAGSSSETNGLVTLRPTWTFPRP